MEDWFSFMGNIALNVSKLRERFKFILDLYNFFDIKHKRGYRSGYKTIRNLADASLASLEAADASIDCQLKISRSKLGGLTDEGTGSISPASISPASIVYLSFNFRQGGNCKLSKATITITLAEYGPNNKKDKPEIYSRHLSVTDYFGPKQLIGESKTDYHERNLGSPRLEVQLIGGEAGGIRRIKKFDRTSHWFSEGSRRSPAKDSEVYRTLLWDLKENPLECRAEHSKEFHTAFVLNHECIPFYIDVETEVKLERKRDRLKQAFSFLKFSPSRPGVARFELGRNDRDLFEKHKNEEAFKLDTLANKLGEEMYKENLKILPRIPDAPITSTPTAVQGDPLKTEPPLYQNEERPFRFWVYHFGC